MTALVEKPTQQREGPWKFTLEQFEQLSNTGIISDQHVELLNGELYLKGLQSPAHAYAIQTLPQRLAEALGDRVCIRAQLPLVLLAPPPDFVEPDVALLKLPPETYKERNATSDDALLVIEVSDSTLERDQGAKLEAYARNNVQEYWILNLNADELEVHRDPKGTKYRSIITLEKGQTVSPLEFEDVKLEWW